MMDGGKETWHLVMLQTVQVVSKPMELSIRDELFPPNITVLCMHIVRPLPSSLHNIIFEGAIGKS